MFLLYFYPNKFNQSINQFPRLQAKLPEYHNLPQITTDGNGNCLPAPTDPQSQLMCPVLNVEPYGAGAGTQDVGYPPAGMQYTLQSPNDVTLRP